MPISEKNHQKDFNIADQFILPSQKIINYDLTCNSSSDIIHDYYHDSSLAINTKSYAEQKDSNNINNSLDHLQHNDLIMMANHAAHTITSSDSSIWVPADKHPQIAPNEDEDWIKTHTNANQPKVNVSRKRSVLSNVSYNSAEEDSCGSDTSDDEDGPITPTMTVKPELTVLTRDTQNHQETSNSLQTKDINSKDVLPRRQDNICTDGQGSSSSFGLATPSNSIPDKTTEPKDDIYIKDSNDSIPLSNSTNMQHFETRNSSLQSCFPYENVNRTSPIHTPQKEYQPTKNSLNVDHPKTANSKKSSWFKDLFPKKSKKTGIMAGLISKQQTNDTPTMSFMKKLSHSASSKSLNSPPTTLKKRPEFAFKRMPLPTSLKKKQATTPPPPSQRPPPIVHTRYPINTELAIYRLSHVKLSNARRPLRQQVVISNMMFWYLSVTEKEQDNHFLDYQEPQYQTPPPPQQQRVYNDYYQANQTQQEACYFNKDIYQATHQSFEPPAPGNSAYHHHVPNYTHQYHHPEYDSSCYYTSSSPPPPNQQEQQLDVEEYASATVSTEKNKLKKKKYKPVRNTQYSPSMAS